MYFIEEDTDEWVVNDFEIGNGRPNIEISVFSEEVPPSEEQVAYVRKITSELESIINSAMELILENYSYEHFRDLGVSEEKLPEETLKAISRVTVLTSLSFSNIAEKEYEASFAAPWDEFHSYDVEFEDEEAVSCSANG